MCYDYLLICIYDFEDIFMNLIVKMTMVIDDSNNEKNDHNDLNNCECMFDSDFDGYPKVYCISYKVYGVDSKSIKHLIIEVKNSYMVGIDIKDIIFQLEKEYINSEFNNIEGEIMYHTVGTEVFVYSSKYVGILSGVTDKAKAIFCVAEQDNLE